MLALTSINCGQGGSIEHYTMKDAHFNLADRACSSLGDEPYHSCRDMPRGTLYNDCPALEPGEVSYDACMADRLGDDWQEKYAEFIN